MSSTRWPPLLSSLPIMHHRPLFSVSAAFLLSILMHCGISLSGGQEISIAVMPSGDPVEQRALEMLAEEYKQQSNGRFNVSIHILQQVQNDGQYRQIAETLRCNGTSMVVSAISGCGDSSSPLVRAATTVGLPVLRTNTPLLECPARPSIPAGHHPLVRAYPSSIPRGEVFSHVMSNLLRWKKLNIFYDDANAGLVDDFVAAAMDTMYTKLRLYHIEKADDGGGVEADPGAAGAGEAAMRAQYEKLLQASQTSVLGDDKNNNLVICAPNTTHTLLQYAGAFDNFNAVNQESLFNSRWLVVFTDAGDVYDLEPSLQGLNNVAVLVLERRFETTTARAITDVVSILTTGLDYFLLMSNDTSLNHEAGGCNQANAPLIMDMLDLNLDNKPEYQTCTPYDAYITEFGPEGKHLAPVALCEDKMLTNTEIFPSEKRGFNGRHFIISTIESPPFVVPPVNSSMTHRGGISMDLLKEMASMLNFTYTVVVVPDNQYGVRNPDGSWTGMVGVLHRKEADMVVAPLSVTAERDTVIDFVDYYNEYGSILLKKPDLNAGKWKVIAEPFSWPVWVGISISVPVAGVAAWLITLMVRNATEKDVDMFSSLDKASWYVFGALFTQGGAYEPATTSGRAFIGCWWAFCIVIVASYGGSLIAYLTVAKGEAPFDSLDGLLEQTAFKWGATGGSVYISAFKIATGGQYKDMWDGIQEFAKSDPEVLNNDKPAQYAKVMAGGYAYISDRTQLERFASQDLTCELVVLPAQFLPMPLAVGLQENAPYRRVIEKAVRMLQESGMVKFYEQTWKPKDQCSNIALPEAKAISLLDMQSAFYCLVGGIFFALCMLVAESLRHCLCSYEAPAEEVMEEQKKDKHDSEGIHNRPTFGHNMDYAGPSNVHALYNYKTNYQNEYAKHDYTNSFEKPGGYYNY